MKKRKIGVKEYEIIQNEQRQVEKYGFVRWKIGHRYGYVAIDECNKKGGILRTHKAGLTHSQAMNSIYDLMTD